jgi:hypothetical protein
LITTQSCDLAWTKGGREQKVEMVQAVRAIGADVLLRRAPQLQACAKAAKLGDKEYRAIRGVIEGEVNGILALPAIPGIISDVLIFDFKSPDLLKIEDVEDGCERSGSDPAWVRIASQDSPYREEVMWTLISLLGRPAIPEYDKQELAEQIFKLVKAAH